MAGAREPKPFEGKEPVREARTETDKKLDTERKAADEALGARLAKDVRKAEEKLRRTRLEIDRTLETAQEEATREAGASVVEPSTLGETLDRQQECVEQALEEVSETAQELVTADRAKAKAVVTHASAQAEMALQRTLEVAQEEVARKGAAPALESALEQQQERADEAVKKMGETARQLVEAERAKAEASVAQVSKEAQASAAEASELEETLERQQERVGKAIERMSETAKELVQAERAKAEVAAAQVSERAQEALHQTLEAVQEQAAEKVAAAVVESSALERTLERQQKRVEEMFEKVSEKAQEIREDQRDQTQAAVARVSEQAQDALRTERARVRKITEREREERERAYLEFISQERRETDGSLLLERKQADLLVSGRDEVLAIISHDLTNLINAISLNATALARALSDEASADKKRVAWEIFKACKVMARWAGDLVDISSLDAGKLRLELHSCSPAEIVDEVSRTFASAAAEKATTVSVKIANTGRPVRCDRDRIVQVLSNLLNNAIKFTPPSGRISLRVEDLQHQVRFSVSDTGPGIAEVDRAKIFDPRWHIESTKGGGTGLGLYICKRVIESHGGRIWVETAPNEGCTFYFTLPAAFSSECHEPSCTPVD